MIRRLGGIALATGAMLAAALAGGSAPGDTEGGVRERALSVVRTLADPRWEGRGVGTAGLDSAARYLAREMAAVGLRPLGDDGGYFQRMEIFREPVDKFMFPTFIRAEDTLAAREQTVRLQLTVRFSKHERVAPPPGSAQ